MAVKFNEFLLEYYKRLIFRNMPIEQYVHFCEFVDNDDLDGHMKSWKENLLKTAPGDDKKYLKDPAGLYIRKDVPDPEEPGGKWELSPEEWEKLFKAFNNAFQEMDAKKKSFQYEGKAKAFLETYFGNDGQLFSYVKADDAAETKITELKKLLAKHEADMRQALKEFFNDDFSWKDLMDGIDSKKYNQNPSFRQRLINIAEALEYDTKFREHSSIKKMVGKELDFGDISKGFETVNIKSARMTQFKLIYPDLLKELYTNKTAFKYFSVSDPTRISKTLQEAQEYIDYNNKDSKDYISPKRPDELTLPQHISQWWDDTYSNYLEKYVKLTGDRMFFSPYAKAIFKEIDKLKIKPTDGLAKILENSDKISDALKKKFKKAPGHFDWFVKTLTELRNTMNGGKAFEKALQNGNSLNAIVREVILKAVQEGKTEEAKTTMEILAAMRYTLTSSKIMDAFNKSDLTIFSDENLSFNKNTGIQCITSALDKGIKKTFQLFGYTLTVAGNLINRTGTKFRGRQDKRTQDAIDAIVAEGKEKEDRLKKSVGKYKYEKAATELKLEDMEGKGITKESMKVDIEKYTKETDSAENAFKNEVKKFSKYLSGIEETLSEEDAVIISDLVVSINSDGIKADLDEARVSEIKDIGVKETVIKFIKEIQKIQKDYNVNIDSLNKRKAQLQELNDATDNLNTYNALIDKTTKEIEDLKTKNAEKARKIEELEQFWNVCNSGIVKSFWGNKAKQQEQFIKDSKVIYKKHVLDKMATY